nr:MAG: hypothetical protein [Bacteriophage sp.]
MLKEMYEQFINSQIITNCYVIQFGDICKYEYYTDDGKIMTASIFSSFKYEPKYVEELINKNILHIIELKFCQ